MELILGAPAGDDLQDEDCSQTVFPKRGTASTLTLILFFLKAFNQITVPHVSSQISSPTPLHNR